MMRQLYTIEIIKTIVYKYHVYAENEQEAYDKIDGGYKPYASYIVDVKQRTVDIDMIDRSEDI